MKLLEPDPVKRFDFRGTLVGKAVARAFRPPPDEPVGFWADRVVKLQNEDAAEPGDYRSAKTPWTRRIQDLFRKPVAWAYDFQAAKWVSIPATEVSVKKSSQSGYSEACMNGIRWRATFRPCNTIYAIDSADEAKKIARRLLRSFSFLDREIFTGDPDDLKTLEFKLRGMELLFYGSFSEGKFANKQAPLLITDELEEHGKTSTRANIKSRKKTSTGGLQVNLSKPKLKGGPIDQAFNSGNQEEFFVPCPHCDRMQFLTFFPEEVECPFSEDIDEIRDEQSGAVVARLPRPLPEGEKRMMKTGRLVYEHCRNLLGRWDKLRIQNETFYECAHCQGEIRESQKRWMIDRGEWLPMAVDATPGAISQHINDLYSEDPLSAWGLIVLEFLDAKEESREALQGFYNHRLGKVWSEEVNTTQESDILDNRCGRTLYLVDGPNSDGQLTRYVFDDEKSAAVRCGEFAKMGMEIKPRTSVCPVYRRKKIPWEDPACLIFGADVHNVNTRWAVLAVHKGMENVALVDWGEDLDPSDLPGLFTGNTWSCMSSDKKMSATWGFVDARWRPKDVYQACLSVGKRLVPVKGMGGATAHAVRLWSYVHVPTYHPRFKEIHFNDQRAKSALYIDRLKKKRKRIWFPSDVQDDPRLIEELCAEWQDEDRSGRMFWSDEPKGPNHFGDCVKVAVLGLDFLTREIRTGG